MIFAKPHKMPPFGHTNGKPKGGNNLMIDKIALTLAIIGGLNWGSIGLFGFDLVAFLFGGQASVMSRIVYGLVGLAALWCISLLFRRHTEPTEHHAS